MQNMNVFEYIEKKGPRYIRKQSEKLAEDHPLRDQGREVALRALEDAGILLLLDREREAEQANTKASIASEKAKADTEAAIALWSRGGIDVDGLCVVFDRLNPAASFELVDSNGKLTQWQQSSPEGSKKQAKRLTKRGKALPALRPKLGHCILCVSEKRASEVAKRFKLNSMSWTNGGFTYWLFAGSPTQQTVRGAEAALIVSDRLNGHTAPLQGAKWLKKPSEAIEAATGRLPRLPSELAEMLRGLTAEGGPVLDQIILG